MSTTTTILILNIVCGVYDVSLEALRSQGRQRELAQPRAVGMGLLRRYASLSLQEIAGALGRLDHTTARHALAVADQLRVTSADAQECERRVRAALVDQRLQRQLEALQQPLGAMWPGLGAPLRQLARRAA